MYMLSKHEERLILGKKIETLRKQKGMTQEELAKKAGFAENDRSNVLCQNKFKSRMLHQRKATNQGVSRFGK